MEFRKIKITDVTLREGDQAPLTSFNASEKSLIALMLSEMGIDVVEVGFGASRADFENIKKVSNIVGNRNTVVSSLGRALENDTIASLEALEKVKNPRIHIFLAMSKEHIDGKFAKVGNSLKERQEKLLIQAKTEVERAKSWAIQNNKVLEIEFSPEDATGNSLKDIKGKKIFDLRNNPDFDFLIKVCEEAVISGATILNIPDTLGNLLPHESYEFFRELNKRLNHLKGKYKFNLSCHIHNDLAMSTANAIESIRGGATYIESTMLGIGERAGNTQTNDIVGIIKTKGEDLGVKLNNSFKYELIGPISDFIKDVLAFDKYFQTPFIGALSDVDGSGVHNAAKDLYGGSKNKRQFRGANLPEFFSPRGGASQIIDMLRNYGIEENKKSEIISKTTKKAAKRSEILKAMYKPNIFATYLKVNGDFEIKKLSFENKKLNLEILLNGKQIAFNGETKGKDGIVKTFVKLLNEYFGYEKIKIKDLRVKAKPSLRQSYDKFFKRAGDIVSVDFKQKAEHILNEIKNEYSYGESIGVNQVILEIDSREVYSNSYDKNVTIGNIKAILEGVLSEL